MLKDIFEMQKYNIPVIEFSLGNFDCKFSRFNQKNCIVLARIVFTIFQIKAKLTTTAKFR